MEKEQIFSPSPNTIVENSKGELLLILKGDYEVNGRISNFWYWREIKKDLSLSEEKCGYGNFFKYNGNLKAVIKIVEIAD